MLSFVGLLVILLSIFVFEIVPLMFAGVVLISVSLFMGLRYSKK